jgi:hypothetical protein
VRRAARKAAGFLLVVVAAVAVAIAVLVLYSLDSPEDEGLGA